VRIEEAQDLETTEEGFASFVPAAIPGPLSRLLEAEIRQLAGGIEASQGRSDSRRGANPREASPRDFSSAAKIGAIVTGSFLILIFEMEGRLVKSAGDPGLQPSI
jgi:hypothetical protein